MRMFLIPSWVIGSNNCDKLLNGHIDHKMVNATRPVVDTHSGAGLKRKRLGEEKNLHLGYGTHESKRRKEQVALRSPVSPLETKLEIAHETSNVVDSSLISSTIESQFSLEILLKHNELRLIDQELAKCQVALEQLRRCHLIPYPINSEATESKLNVSDGTGPTICQENKTAPWAPPFGVTDGPYTRHYAKWLIPDPSFDGVTWRGDSKSRVGETVSEGRATRHSVNEGAAKASKSGLRGATSQKLLTPPTGFPQSKEKVGPCILRRGDGKTVKLVCLDCYRENFSSTQGFINHCRIAHRRDFKSHEEAAIASGQLIKFDQAGSIIGNQRSSAVTHGLVHPLVRSAPTGKEAIDACKALLSRVADSKAMLREGRLPGFTSIPKSAKPSPYTPNPSFNSLKTPHLSELLHRKGFSGNVDEIIHEAQQKIYLEENSHDEDSDSSEILPDTEAQTPNPSSLKSQSHSALPQMRMPARVGLSSPARRPECIKGISERKQDENLENLNSYCSHITPATNIIGPVTPKKLTRSAAQDSVEIRDTNMDLEIINRSSINDLSPQTVTSNNAPSLVSDDGEYDEDNVDSSGRSEDDADESDVAEINIEEDIEPQTLLGNRKNESRGGRTHRTEGKEKHVTFVSPIQESGRKRIHFR